MAALGAAIPSYRPCQYDVADIAAGLSTNLQELAATHLTSGACGWVCEGSSCVLGF